MNLVIPTHHPHYDYNISFLNSFDNFCLDKSDVKINLIVNNKDFLFFEKIPIIYPELNISIVSLRDLILKIDGCDSDDESMFETKYPLQSLKKLFSYVVTNDDYIVIDSENLCLRNFKFRDIIENEKRKPIFYTENIFQDLQIKVLNSCNSILNYDTNKWFFLKSYWFYEKKIVSKLIEELKELYGNITLRLKGEIFFEYQLYCGYIVKNNLKENINIDTYCEENMFFSKILVDNTSTFEHVCVQLNNENLPKYLKIIESMGDKIIRLHWMSDEIKNEIINKSNIFIGTFHWDN
jgi:hypothetical protein